MKSKFKNILITIMSISFIMSAFFGSVHYYCFNEKFYENEHNKILLYGKHINEHIGISNDQLKQLTSFTLDYLNDPDASLDLKMEINGVTREVYTDDEKLHMVDVRKLNLCANYLLIGSTVILISCIAIFIIKKYDIGSLFIKYKNILFIFLIFLGLLGSWILIDFDGFWTFFHHIFFSGNDLWLLDLRKDILIMIVPPEFFNHLIVRIVITFACIILFAYFILKYMNRRKQND